MPEPSARFAPPRQFQQRCVAVSRPDQRIEVERRAVAAMQTVGPDAAVGDEAGAGRRGSRLGESAEIFGLSPSGLAAQPARPAPTRPQTRPRGLIRSSRAWRRQAGSLKSGLASSGGGGAGGWSGIAGRRGMRGMQDRRVAPAPAQACR
jgi:hypothetical protein